MTYQEAQEIVAKQAGVTRFDLIWSQELQERAVKLVIESMQDFGNQRFNAALSEAIEKVKNETSETHRDFKAWTGNEIIDFLEGLKIKP